ncbi:hypothetical protein [Flaviflexus sp.]|uniref:hypothetical protein n=1 Tax=Flaviflexus sp. TaxID=1969482 RepID=UPI003F8DB7F3
MGQDMAIAVTRDPHRTTDADRWCKAHNLYSDVKNDLTRRALIARIEQLSLTPDDAAEWDHLTEGAATPHALRAALIAAVNTISGPRRDVTELRIEDTWWIGSGGFSSGDAPTDAYDPITLLDAFRITDQPVTTDELINASKQRAEASTDS